MADITRRFGWRHLRSAPTTHIRHHKRGRLVHGTRTAWRPPRRR
ncbi:hypothetical protein ACFWCB_05830 [Streptomyces sp. NPDC060048]